MHLEVNEQLSLREAHRLATQLEEEVRRLPSMGDANRASDAVVNIHIEPLGAHIASADHASDEMRGLAGEVEHYISGLADEFAELTDCHEVLVRQVENKTLVSCHCTMDGSLPITAIHDVTGVLEQRVREKFPHIARVTIHPEPSDPR